MLWNLCLYVQLLFPEMIKKARLTWKAKVPVHCVTLPSTAALDCESIQGNIFNLEMRKCIFKGETSFLYLLNPMISILWMLEELGSQSHQLTSPPACADTEWTTTLQDTVTWNILSQTDSFGNQITSTFHFQGKEQQVFCGSQVGNKPKLYATVDRK